MRRISLILLLMCLAMQMAAQPQARRRQQQEKKTQSNANNMTTRARIAFPTMAPMSEDVVWRRDSYSTIPWSRWARR